MYDGMWENGIKQGQGRYTWANGSYFEGLWINNVHQGDIVPAEKNRDRVPTKEHVQEVLAKKNRTETGVKLKGVDTVDAEIQTKRRFFFK